MARNNRAAAANAAETVQIGLPGTEEQIVETEWFNINRDLLGAMLEVKGKRVSMVVFLPSPGQQKYRVNVAGEQWTAETLDQAKAQACSRARDMLSGNGRQVAPM